MALLRFAALMLLSSSLLSVSGCRSEGTAQRAGAAREIVLSPGDDIQAAIDSHLEGTTFRLRPGVYRGQVLTPRNRQAFIGEPGAILSGAVPLDDWIAYGRFWRHDGLPSPLPRQGDCAGGGDLCTWRETLFNRGMRYRRVLNVADVREGTWFFDHERQAALISAEDSPKGVEMALLPAAFHGTASDVLIEGLVVERYAPAAQHGAIHGHDGQRWTIRNTIARENHSVGIVLNTGALVDGGGALDNGQSGINGAEAHGARVSGVEIARNNTAGFNSAWEAGGLKIVRSHGVVVEGSHVHGNDGPGLWGDIDMKMMVLRGNRVHGNADSGIQYEISFDGEITGNAVSGNGWKNSAWLWGSQILVQNSSGVEVSGNCVETGPQGGNGIGLIFQERDGGPAGPYRTDGNRITGNRITHHGTDGHSGFVADHHLPNPATFRNIWNDNTWIVTSPGRTFWTFEGREMNWTEGRREMGMEPAGRLQAKPASCRR